MKIDNYNDFIEALLAAGMAMGGENGEGIFTLAGDYTEKIRWHTGETDTDPWEWRMRVLHERQDIAYGKLFFKKSGFITKEWYPCFYAVRRQSGSLEDAYEEGLVSREARSLYELVAEHRELPLHELKLLSGMGREDKSIFDKALTELQMRMYITMCGNARKHSSRGEEYGWSSTVLCTVEHFWGEGLDGWQGMLTAAEAYGRLREHILRLNPSAEEKKIGKFIEGR